MEKLCEERKEQCRDRIMNTRWRHVHSGASEKPPVGKMPLLDVTPFKRSPVCGQCGHSLDSGGGGLFDRQLNSSVVECLFDHCFHPIRVAEVAREHGWHPPKSLDSDENFKLEHTLFCRELRFVAN